MSHVVDMSLPVTDIELLNEAALELGLEVRNKQQFHWYGQHVGDYPLPAGFKKEDMGKCLYALGVKGKPNAYEIGVVKRRDGKPGYTMLWDFWAGGNGLEEVIGENGNKLKQRYSVKVAVKEARRNGYRVTTEEMEDGSVRVKVRS